MAMDTTDAPQMLEHIKKPLTFTPHDTRWIPCSARFACCGVTPGGKGALAVHELSRGELKTPLELSSARPSGIKCMTFGASRIEDRHLAVGDYDGTLTILDLERAASAAPDGASSSSGGARHDAPDVFSVRAHGGIVNAIDGVGGTASGGARGAPEIATAGRDGLVRVWDPRVSHPVVSLEPEGGTSARDCWAVTFGDSYDDEERCVCAGYDNGDVKLFDLRANAVRWETNCGNGVTCVQFDRPDIEMNKLLVTTLESRFRCYDMRTQHAQVGFSHLAERAHRSTVWLGRHLPQNRDIFMTGGGNGGLNIYKYHYPMNRVKKHPQDGAPVGVVGNVELLNSRVISTQPVVSFDWSPDREGLCCLSCLDQTLRVYIVTKLDKY